MTYAANATLRSLAQHPCCQFAHGDIADTGLASALVRDGAIDAVVNLAAELHVDRLISAPFVFIRTDIVGTFSLLRADSWVKVYDEIAPERTGHGLPLMKCEAYDRVYDQHYGSR